jgi:hypothetical protein
VVLSGVRDPDAPALAAAWAAHGLRAVRILHRAGFACLHLEGAQ